jgi:hypothetical protein
MNTAEIRVGTGENEMGGVNFSQIELMHLFMYERQPEKKLKGCNKTLQTVHS